MHMGACMHAHITRSAHACAGHERKTRGQSTFPYSSSLNPPLLSQTQQRLQSVVEGKLDVSQEGGVACRCTRVPTNLSVYNVIPSLAAGQGGQVLEGQG